MGFFVGVFPVRYIFMIFGVKANFKYFSRKYFTVIYDPGLPSRPFLTFPAPAPTSTLKHVILRVVKATSYNCYFLSLLLLKSTKF